MKTHQIRFENPLLHPLRFTLTLILAGIALRGASLPPRQTAQNVLESAGIPGGLIVHVGCGSGKITAELRMNERFLVHGLDANQENVDSARAYIHTTGHYGEISVDVFDGNHLPHTDNLVNLIVLSDSNLERPIPKVEILRALCPGGRAVHLNDEGRIAGAPLLKPRPDSIDEWTHFLHGPDNNAVAQDTAVNIPRSFHWVTGPRWARSHEELASVSAAVTAAGRIYYIVDEAPLASIRFRGNWKLVARDAFNGVLLWKRAIPTWNDHLRHFRSGPAHLPRRLIADGNRIYVTSSFSGPVIALDGSTGKLLRQYDNTEQTEEMLIDNETLYIVIGTSEADRVGGGLYGRGEPEPASFRRLCAVAADSGKTLWTKDLTKEGVLPLSLAIKGQHCYFQSLSAVVCLNTVSGSEVWKTPRKTLAKRMGFSAPTLVATDKVILCADRDVADKKELSPSTGGIKWGVHGWNENGFSRKGKSTLRAYSASDGTELWSTACKEGYNSPVDVFVVDNVVWIGPDFRGFNLLNGKQIGKIDTKAPKVGMPHHRCYRNKATEELIFTGKSGIEVLDIEKGWLSNNSWVRGTCQYGIIPANGLIYAPPDACACFLTVKSPGFFAVAPQKGETAAMPFPKKTMLETSTRAPSPIKDTPDTQGDWPMYRCNSARSGNATCAIPEFPAESWSVKVNGRLTQPVVADGRLFVASVDTHTVHALDANNGQKLWQTTAGGRVDSSPTYYNNTIIFGSADGWVYCAAANDGSRIWRFRAAPVERLVSAYGQLESTWPVHGAVLVQNDTVYALAGRSSYMDGGLVLYRLNPRTGEQLSRTSLYHLDPETGEQLTSEGRFNMEGTASDILSGDGNNIFLKYFTFDRNGKRTENSDLRLFSITGFLGEEWFVRSYWIYGIDISAGWGGWAKAGNQYASGRILCFNDKKAYGYGRTTIKGGKTGHTADRYHLFGGMLKRETQEQSNNRRRRTPSPPATLWSDDGSIIARAMVLGDERLAVAGPLNLGRKNPESMEFLNEKEALSGFRGQKGIVLRIVRTEDGTRISDCKLSSMPVFDGMAAAKGKLYLATKDSTVKCFKSGKGNPLPAEASESVHRGDEIDLSIHPDSKSDKSVKPKAKALPRKLPGPSKHTDFQHVNAAAVTASDLGYRLSSAQGEPALALKKLDPATAGKVLLSAQIRPAPEFPHPPNYENAFLAFGSSTDDNDLIKCGIKYAISKAVVIVGGTKEGKQHMLDIKADSKKPLTVEVAVDTDSNSIVLAVGNKELKIKLDRKPDPISYAGYCTLNAVSDFSPVQVQKK